MLPEDAWAPAAAMQAPLCSPAGMRTLAEGDAPPHEYLLQQLAADTHAATTHPPHFCSAGLAQSHAQAAGSPVALAAPARLFCTDNFIDKTTSDGRFDFSEWVRAYGKYLEEQVRAPPAAHVGAARPPACTLVACAVTHEPAAVTHEHTASQQ